MYKEPNMLHLQSNQWLLQEHSHVAFFMHDERPLCSAHLLLGKSRINDKHHAVNGQGRFSNVCWNYNLRMKQHAVRNTSKSSKWVQMDTKYAQRHWRSIIWFIWTHKHTFNPMTFYTSAKMKMYLSSYCSIGLFWWRWFKDPLLLLWWQCRIQWNDFDVTDFRSKVVDFSFDPFAGLINFLSEGTRFHTACCGTRTTCLWDSNADTKSLTSWPVRKRRQSPSSSSHIWIWMTVRIAASR